MNPSVHTAEVLPARAVLFLGILAFHALLAYLLANGLLEATVKLIAPTSTEASFIPEEKPLAEQPKERQSDMRPTTLITVNKPEIPINLPIDPPEDALVTQMVTDPPPVGMSEPVRVAEPPLSLVGRNIMPNTEDYYPARDRRDGNEGTAEVRSCVNANGRLDGTPTVENSSGRASLDNAAVRVARDGKYARAMRGETPVPNCYRFRVTFTMH